MTHASSWSRLMTAVLLATPVALTGCPARPLPVPPAPPGVPDPEKQPPGEPIHDVTPKSGLDPVER